MFEKFRIRDWSVEVFRQILPVERNLVDLISETVPKWETWTERLLMVVSFKGEVVCVEPIECHDIIDYNLSGELFKQFCSITASYHAYKESELWC